MPDTNMPSVMIGAITFKVKALLDALALVCAAVPSKSSIPILRNAHFAMDDTGDVIITGTDMEICVEAFVSAEYPPMLSPFLVEAKSLLLLLKQLPPAGNVTITAANQEPWGALVQCDDVSATIPGGPVVDFPTMEFRKRPADPSTPYTRFEMTGRVLGAALARVSFAMSTEETRYYLNGIHFTRDAHEGALHLAATDGHRLAWQRTSVELENKAPFATDVEKGETENGIIVPRPMTALLDKAFKNEDGVVRFEVTDTKIRATTPRLRITSKLIDGSYPDFRRVIPPEAADRSLVLPLAPVLTAVKRVKALKIDRSQPICLRLLKGVGIYADAFNSEGGGIQNLPIPMSEPPAFNAKLAMQSRYLESMAVAAAPHQSVRMTLSAGDENAALVTGPMRFDAPGWTCVIMPMRV